MAAQSELKFGFAFSYMRTDGPTRQIFDQMVELVRECRQAGFDLIYRGHHFLDPAYVSFQSLPIIARLAAESGDMVMLHSDLLPLNHPVRVAEDLASLDVITGGRSALLAVLGYVEKEFQAFGIPIKARAQRFREAYELIARLSLGEKVDFEGRHYQLKGIEIGRLRPLTKPRPPIWATGHNAAGIKRCAEFGDVWFISHQPTLDELRVQVAQYRAHLKNRPPQPFHQFCDHGIRLPILREAMILEDGDEAVEIFKGPVMKTIQNYIAAGQMTALNDPASYLTPFEVWRQNRAVLGNPAEAIREIQRYHAELGVDCMVLKLVRDGIPFQKVVEAVRVVGKSVIPYFR